MNQTEKRFEDVAEPDQIVSGAAVTGQMNNAWRILARGFFMAHIGGLDPSTCTTGRWMHRLRRQVEKLEERKKIRTATRPAIRTVVWR